MAMSVDQYSENVASLELDRRSIANNEQEDGYEGSTKTGTRSIDVGRDGCSQGLLIKIVMESTLIYLSFRL
jgi:hypothetical protein